MFAPCENSFTNGSWEDRSVEGTTFFPRFPLFIHILVETFLEKFAAW